MEYVHRYVLNFHEAPRGRQALVQRNSPCPLVVDFDELVGPLPLIEDLTVENLGSAVAFHATSPALAARLLLIAPAGVERTESGVRCAADVAMAIATELLGRAP